MAVYKYRYPQNVPGQFYVDDQCLDCDACRATVPSVFKRDDSLGIAYVYRQPETLEEIDLCMECVDGCPTLAIGHDGLNPLPPPEGYDDKPEP